MRAGGLLTDATRAAAGAGAEARAPVPRLDHAVYGNGRVLALVSPTSAIEWLCLPRFDSGSVFGRLLDAARGGCFRILPRDGERAGRLDYVPNTNVVRLLFEDADAAWEVVDFAPRIPRGLDVEVPIEIVRIVRPLRGLPRLRVDFDPRPDYARASGELHETAHGLEVRGLAHPLCLATNLPLSYLLSRTDFVLDHPIFFTLTWGPREEPPTLALVEHARAMTIAGWRAWAKTCALPTYAPTHVLRSALCLKLHAYHDTGAIIAAATTSIPEAMGTPRTWDYRYCWLRDAAFVVEALRRLGHLAEGERFIRYLRDTIGDEPLQPVYGIGGERDLTEEPLPHLAGFGGNGWVRRGNAAFAQRQHDLMGEIVLCLDTFLGDPRIVHDEPQHYFPLIARLVERAIELAPRHDTGIWEFRTMLRPYTFSRAMCWAAIQRGAKIARRFGRHADAERWERIAASERDVILTRGYDPRLGYFTQALDGEHPDASNLLLPTIGIIDARDPRFVSTVDAYAERLTAGGFMQRYCNLDDFGETTSAFTICSFWWAEALALMGRLDEAREVFEHLIGHRNPVGLFSEDIDPATGRLLGNFPQAYTHVGLIHAATTIGELLEAREGRVRAWA
ncbi:MAG: glycoside hydrolase family 15 protein [Deltaproteobacteria bacterium]|nr:glycoside hydrolase family 15 protein [Deltaproteobacteria bacterium]